MRKVVLFLALVSSTVVLAQASDPVIMTNNGVPVPRSEFEYSYNKNNGADVIDKKSIDEYVDLFISRGREFPSLSTRGTNDRFFPFRGKFFRENA